MAALQILSQECLDCHTGPDAEAGLDLAALFASSEIGKASSESWVGLEQVDVWVRIHDRVEKGEMPPGGELDSGLRAEVVKPLFDELVRVDRDIVERQGRATWRRMNRFEYENSVRELLDAPWLQLASILPADGEKHYFNKLSDALDVSHVNMARYLQAADYALREVMKYERLHSRAATIETHPKATRFYAREQSSFSGRVHYSPFNRSPERATFPLLDYDADLPVLNDPEHPFTVGEADPALREREAFGVVASSYEPIEVRFSSFKAPAAGRYTLRFKGYTFWVQGEDKRWWRPHRERTSRGRRSEPVTIYSVSPPRQLRRIGEFDFNAEPNVQELSVWLLAGESIQPDAVRLFRSRPPNWHNPLATKEGMPGVAFNWMEVEGPILEERETTLFPTQPMKHTDKRNTVTADETIALAEPRIAALVRRAFRISGDINGQQERREVQRYLQVFEAAMREGMKFEDALISSYSAILCSPLFLCFEESPGQLTSARLADRLGLFLWNSLPTQAIAGRVADLDFTSDAGTPPKLRPSAPFNLLIDEMLEDSRSEQFINAFLDYWLDLRKINDTSPDEFMYPDYYLDDSLVDAALLETRMFVAELIRSNLPIRNLIDSDFTFANERLAKHYDFSESEGAELRRVEIPKDSPRGGLLTQASILKVTANGATTSPVIRGAWINERLLGILTPPPPASVPAIEPDTRGATTIREQLAKHQADESCAVCHRQIDPPGFALESFDVAGGYRQRYRSMTEVGEPLPGFGKNGQPFTFRSGPEVDASGRMPDGREFANIHEFKRLLLADERQIARNFLSKLVTYATGAAPRLSDRPEIESILDRTSQDGYPVRTLIAEVANSRMFLHK
ncbi:MAG: DUF1588 domain-containing protein [Pirellulaceae bacterium]